MRSLIIIKGISNFYEFTCILGNRRFTLRLFVCRVQGHTLSIQKWAASLLLQISKKDLYTIVIQRRIIKKNRNTGDIAWKKKNTENDFNLWTAAKDWTKNHDSWAWPEMRIFIEMYGAHVATVREKYLENEMFFQVREISGNFVDGQGN